MRCRWLFSLAFLGLVSGCDQNPWMIVLEAEMGSVPAEYVGWFREVAYCLDRPHEATLGRFSEITWSTGSDIYNSRDDLHAWGLWQSRHKITIHSAHTRERWVVKHEMIHDLLGHGGHPEEEFTACTG